MHTVGRPLLYSDEDLRRILSARHFVNVRTTLGGPAPSETGRALDESVRCSTSTTRGSPNAAALAGESRCASERRAMTPCHRGTEHRAVAQRCRDADGRRGAAAA